MRSWLAAVLLSYLLAAPVACESRQEAAGAQGQGGTAVSVDPRLELSPRVERPISSAVVQFEKELQAKKLLPPPLDTHAPQLAFGKGVLGQLTSAELRVFDSKDFALLTTLPLDSPRVLLALADGSLLAVGARAMLRWDRETKHPTKLAPPVLMPGSELYADPQQSDVVWVFDAGHGRGAAATPPTLSRCRLTSSALTVLLPEQTIELSSPPTGVFGPTREGVWLYATAGRVERLSPGGLRLPGLTLGQQALPTWVLPARRLDQSLWLHESGDVSRVLVSPSYKPLSTVKLGGPALAAAVGDEGRLLAAVVVAGPGPRFALELLDQNLAPLGHAALPSDEPTGADDWVRVVTENQTVVAAPREPRAAVGGPGRVLIFDAQGNQISSISSH